MMASNVKKVKEPEKELGHKAKKAKKERKEKKETKIRQRTPSTSPSPPPRRSPSISPRSRRSSPAAGSTAAAASPNQLALDLKMMPGSFQREVAKEYARMMMRGGQPAMPAKKERR